MATVIISRLWDYHAAAVHWALDAVNFPVFQWEGPGVSDERCAAIDLVVHDRASLGGWQVRPDDVIWFRRPRRYQTDPAMAACDRTFALREARRFTASLGLRLEGMGCRCINPPRRATAIDHKAAQIELARACGMHVPNTIMGNDPREIRRYIEDADGRWIHKPFYPHVWRNGPAGTCVNAVTSELTRPLQFEDATLRFSPGIYQQLVAKTHDVRLMLIGDRLRAFGVYSSALDWRLECWIGGARLEEVPIPAREEERVREFIARAGIVFGCFDFAIGVDGRWWFLEVNESGQFLWIDQMLPEANLLQDFLRFLTGAGNEVAFPALCDFHFDESLISSEAASEEEFVTEEA